MPQIKTRNDSQINLRLQKRLAENQEWSENAPRVYKIALKKQSESQNVKQS